MDESLVAKLLDVGTECEFPAGHVLIEPGQPGSGLYMIRHGTVTVDAHEGTRELGAGNVVGEVGDARLPQERCRRNRPLLDRGDDRARPRLLELLELQ